MDYKTFMLLTLFVLLLGKLFAGRYEGKSIRLAKAVE